MHTSLRHLLGCAAFSALLAAAGCATPAAPKTTEVIYPAVDLARTPDGTYRGAAEHRGFTYEVEATVKAHRIADIQIVKNKKTRYGRKAEDVIPLVLEHQRADVDGISGATLCSTGLKKAVADALQQGAKP